MRRVVFGPPPPGSEAISPLSRYLLECFREVSSASFENDLGEVADAYTITNYTETRTLDAGTATAADIANVLCTLIQDMKARGVKKGS